MTTIAALLANKTLKRTDQGMMVRLEDIHFREGFNARFEDERLRNSIEEDAQFTLQNGMADMPQLKVEPREEGGVWAVDGHRRPRIVRRAIELGAKLADKDGNVWLPVKPFKGNATDRHFETLNSQKQLELTPLEIMRKVKDLSDGVEGEPPVDANEIALRTGFKRQYIDQLLKLASGGEAVHALVQDGSVSADIASTMVRTHGDQAAEEIKKELAKAKSQGKAKVTKGTIKGKPLPSHVVADLTVNLKRVVQAIPAESRSTLESYRTGAITDPETPVTMPVRELLALVMASGNVDDVREELERKAAKKAEKAAQASQPA